MALPYADLRLSELIREVSPDIAPPTALVEELQRRAALLNEMTEDHPGLHSSCDACALLTELGEFGVKGQG